MKKAMGIIILLFTLISNCVFAGERVSLGFLYNSSNPTNLVRRTNGSINEVAPTYFDIDDKGNLEISNELSEKFIKAMKEDNIKITPFLSNHWSRSKARKAIENKENLVKQIVEVINKYELDGINVDLENLTANDRDDFTQFVRYLKDNLPQGKQLTISVSANPYSLDFGWQASYDYKALGEIADYLFIMAYDEHSTGGSAGPVASAEFVELSIQYALQNVDKSKIVLGIPLYGRYWKEGAEFGGDAIVIGDVPRILKAFNGEETYDETLQTAIATFEVPEGSDIKVNGIALEEGKYTVWYENEQSIKYKLELINKYNLKGAGVWALGQEKVDVWKYYKEALNEAFEEEEIIGVYEYFELIQFAPANLTVSINMEKPNIKWENNVKIATPKKTTDIIKSKEFDYNEQMKKIRITLKNDKTMQRNYTTNNARLPQERDNKKDRE